MPKYQVTLEGGFKLGPAVKELAIVAATVRTRTRNGYRAWVTEFPASRREDIAPTKVEVEPGRDPPARLIDAPTHTGTPVWVNTLNRLLT